MLLIKTICTEHCIDRRVFAEVTFLAFRGIRNYTQKWFQFRIIPHNSAEFQPVEFRGISWNFTEVRVLFVYGISYFTEGDTYKGEKYGRIYRDKESEGKRYREDTHGKKQRERDIGKEMQGKKHQERETGKGTRKETED
jgi:hypothetical protein